MAIFQFIMVLVIWGLSIDLLLKTKRSLSSIFLNAGLGLFVISVFLNVFLDLRSPVLFFIRTYLSVVLIVIGFFLLVRKHIK
ncbi:hypothetical protein H0I25_08515 [Cellulophaga sp. HaHa_2_95]|uniref:hypothetical protein n=1 Tax=Cellulophaga TaxID=104264 RepID=UPI0015F58E58|nr:MULTISPECIES: hypothetical protein [Cellulophaga]MBA6316808.1 hypothetical protein [Cellulophaga baltica]QXP57807.1 hypothetical protein H0I25_08515 [Cellulophaga sp. HaHa_2_95]